MTPIPRPSRGSLTRHRSVAVAFLLAVVSFLAMGSSQARATDGMQPIVALGYDPADESILRALPHEVQRSGDGATWEPAGTPLEGGPIAALTVAAGGGAVYVAVPGAGVLHLEPDGSWALRNGDLPATNVTSLAAHADQPETLYAYIPELGIFRTRDAGGTWQLMDRGPADITRLLHSNLPGSMATGWLYAIAGNGVQVSMDCFCLWRTLGDLAGATAVAFDPTDPARLYVAAAGGFFRSGNGGLDWVGATSPDPSVSALLVTTAGDIFAATTRGRLFHSVDQAETWEAVGE